MASKAVLLHPSGIDLCPLGQWTAALDRLLRKLRHGTLERAGGYKALVANYRGHFSGHKCDHLAAINGSDFALSFVLGEESWPPSKRSRDGRRPPLLIDMGHGTTGTRFLTCVFRRLKIGTFHNTPPQNDTVADLTTWYDGFGALLDSPIPYLLDALLATHLANETNLFISVRDPWDWVTSRRKHPTASSWYVSTGGCGSIGVLIGRHESSNDEVARDLLVSWSWAICVATNRDVRPVPIVNLFDDDQCTSALMIERAMRHPKMHIAPPVLAHAWGSCGRNLSDACPLWKNELLA